MVGQLRFIRVRTAVHPDDPTLTKFRGDLQVGDATLIMFSLKDNNEVSECAENASLYKLRGSMDFSTGVADDVLARARESACLALVRDTRSHWE